MSRLRDLQCVNIVTCDLGFELKRLSAPQDVLEHLREVVRWVHGEQGKLEAPKEPEKKSA